MKRDCGDILDRWSIAKLKSKRIGTEENKREFLAFEKEKQKLINFHSYYPIEDLSTILCNINDYIWQCEAGLKSSKEKLKNPYYILDEDNNEALAKIGAMTIIIRNFNQLRVKMKNLINKLVNEGFEDVKKHHLSE